MAFYCLHILISVLKLIVFHPIGKKLKKICQKRYEMVFLFCKILVGFEGKNANSAAISRIRSDLKNLINCGILITLKFDFKRKVVEALVRNINWN